MKTFKLLLEEFDNTLQKYNLANYVKLQKPLAEEEIDRYLSLLKISNKEFKSLYRWKNGFESANGYNTRNQIFDFGALLSLEQILESAEYGFDIWGKKFLPFIAAGDGPALLFNYENGKNSGKIYVNDPPLLLADEPISYYDSIYTLLATTIEAYQKGIFIYNSQDKWLSKDVFKFSKIAKTNNPHSDYWNFA